MATTTSINTSVIAGFLISAAIAVSVTSYTNRKDEADANNKPPQKDKVEALDMSKCSQVGALDSRADGVITRAVYVCIDKDNPREVAIHIR